MSSLTDDEMARIKSEIFDNVLAIGAEPYIGVRAIYDVIRANVTSSSVTPTTSATAVTAAGAATLTLASVTGYAAQQRVVLDVDDARETCTIKVVSGSTIAVNCRYLHAGTYPVEVESPLTIVRGILSDLVTLEQISRTAFDTAGVKRVDEIEFFGRADGGSKLVQIDAKRNELRGRLASATGLTGILRELMSRVGAPSGIEVY